MSKFIKKKKDTESKAPKVKEIYSDDIVCIEDCDGIFEEWDPYMHFACLKGNFDFLGNKVIDLYNRDKFGLEIVDYDYIKVLYNGSIFDYEVAALEEYPDEETGLASGLYLNYNIRCMLFNKPGIIVSDLSKDKDTFYILDNSKDDNKDDGTNLWALPIDVASEIDSYVYSNSEDIAEMKRRNIKKKIEEYLKKYGFVKCAERKFVDAIWEQIKEI